MVPAETINPCFRVRSRSGETCCRAGLGKDKTLWSTATGEWCNLSCAPRRRPRTRLHWL